MKLAERFERLNALAKLTSASRYLEIGVAKGATFDRVSIPYKVGVDPKFKCDVRARSDGNTIFHEVTSDAFFTTLAHEHGPFDLIYLDGLHTFEQTLRDFCASLRHAHAQTISTTRCRPTGGPPGRSVISRGDYAGDSARNARDGWVMSTRSCS